MRKDPGNPRLRDETRSPPDRHDMDESIGVVDAIALATRGLCLVGVFVLLAVSAFLAISVFYAIGSLIRDPQTAKGSVSAIAELISAEDLMFTFGGEEQVYHSFRGSVVRTESGGVEASSVRVTPGPETDPSSVNAVEEAPGRYSHLGEHRFAFNRQLDLDIGILVWILLAGSPDCQEAFAQFNFAQRRRLED